MNAQIKTASDLRAHIEGANPDTHYFDRKTMRFFGDSMRNFGARRCRVRTYSGDTVDAWELFRCRPVKHGLKSSSYWDAETYRQVFGEVVD
jgi:hypothetical protein